MKGFLLNFIRITNKNARSVFNACDLPLAVDAAKVKTGRGLYDFPFFRTEEHLHMLFKVSLHVNDVLGIADEFLDLLVLYIDLAVLCVPLA